MPDQTRASPYDGVRAFPANAAPKWTGARRLQVALTGLVAAGPPAGLALGVWMLWGHGLDYADVLSALGFFLLTGFGVTVGFHRLITHRSFTARPWLRYGLAIAGSMGFQGAVTDWVATHRRHHAFTDRPGDPHSPYRYGTGAVGQLRGLADAHLGWMFRSDPTSTARYAPDLLADPTMVAIARLFPLWCALSLALPFGAGWALGGDLRSAWTAFLWAGLVRILLLQHVTWSVNSLCHMIGSRPHPSRRFDRSTDLWPLALLSFGESWHNGHHSSPSCARHGIGPHQIDPSAGLIRAFERLGWATDVHWPTPRPPAVPPGDRLDDRLDDRRSAAEPARHRTRLTNTGLRPGS